MSLLCPSFEFPLFFTTAEIFVTSNLPLQNSRNHIYFLFSFGAYWTSNLVFISWHFNLLFPSFHLMWCNSRQHQCLHFLPPSTQFSFIKKKQLSLFAYLLVQFHVYSFNPPEFHIITHNFPAFEKIPDWACWCNRKLECELHNIAAVLPGASVHHTDLQSWIKNERIFGADH